VSNVTRDWDIHWFPKNFKHSITFVILLC
jgi:hypothetical protein